MSRARPSKPLEMKNPENGAARVEEIRKSADRLGESGFERLRQNHPRRRWWRPASAVGRVFLLMAALIALSGFSLSAYLLKSYLGRDGRFRISGAGNIAATGLTELSRADMLPVFGEDIGRNIFFVPLRERRRQLEEIPWVERATVMRLLPDQIRVSIVERQPVAYVRQGQQIGLVDANGVLLTMPAAMMAQHHYSFPVVSGIDAQEPLVSRKARMKVYQRLLAELDANGQKLSEQISEIDLTDPEDARVLMPEQGGDILAHFGEEKFLERYQRYKAHINEWRQQYPKLAAVDLRYEQKVVLEMHPGTDVAQDAAAAEQTAAGAGDSKPSDIDVKAAEDRGKATAKPATKASTKPKTAPPRKNAKALKAAAAKTKLARNNRKRAEANRAALNMNRQKSAPTARPAVSAGEGQ
jgi:cell division protein FtsQ